MNDTIPAKDRAELRRLFKLKKDLLARYGESKRVRIAYKETIEDICLVCDRNRLKPSHVEQAIKDGSDLDNLPRWQYGLDPDFTYDR
jgi:hypothetical protein